MLTVMRRHVSWGLKVILGIIALSFIFYFGYNQLGGQQGREAAVLLVGKEPITSAWFQFFYNEALKRSQEEFKESQVPDFVLKMVQEQTRQQLVFRNLMKQFATQLGIHVTDRELAETIAGEKDFDPISYKDFLKGFFYRNAFAYEDLLREELQVGKFQKWAKSREPQLEMPEKWSFETLTLTGNDKKQLAATIFNEWKNGKNPLALLKKHKLEPKKTGPLSIEEHQNIFQEKLELSEYISLFSMNKPVQKGERFLLARIVEKNGGKDLQENSRKTNLADIWFRDFAKRVKVKSYFPAEE